MNKIQIMLHSLLKDMHLILASGSPRRKEIFTLLGLRPDIIPADIHEPIENIAPPDLVMKHATHKVQNIQTLVDPDGLLIGADTLVCINNRILGKPKDKEEAKLFLQELSGRRHKVYTGVCLYRQNQYLTDYESSKVDFKMLNDNEIDEYIETGEPMDKAGAYGIQGYGSQFIKSIEGCYFNVMGFPVFLFYTMINKLLGKENRE